MSLNNDKKEYLILFCGLPGTLKTYISIRLSGRLGYAYFPSKAMGDIAEETTGIVLQKRRIKRYHE